MRQAFSFLCNQIKPYKWWYVLILQAPFLTGFFPILNNYSFKMIIDILSGETSNNKTIMSGILLFFGAQIFLDFFWRISNFAEIKCQPFVRRNIILHIYNHIQNQDYNYFQSNQTGSLISKAKGIIDGYDNIYEDLYHKVGSFFWWTFFPIIGLFFVNFTIGIVVLIWAILFFMLMYPMMKKLNHLSELVSQEKHGVFGNISDNIANIFTVFTFANRKKEIKKLENKIENGFIKAEISAYKYDIKFNIIATLLYYPMILFVFIFSLYCRKKNLLTSGDFVFILSTFIMSICFNLWKFLSSMANFMKHIGDFKSSLSILNIKGEMIDKKDAKELIIWFLMKNFINFKNIEFSYENGDKVFNGLTLEISKGQKIGLVGSSGAGKSTLVNLLLKNFAITNYEYFKRSAMIGKQESDKGGDIIINNQSIYDVSSDSLRSQISLIPQDIMLFHRTIGENIGYAKENVTQNEIENAAKMANIHDFIETLPEKYNTLVGERGIKLSGGQRQRIAIARAILKNAPILILDEATSALDSETESEIQKSINTMLENNNATVIAIAHRLSTIKHMDRIIVMEGGKVAEDGSFSELMSKKDGKFKELWDHQVNGMVI